MSDAKSKSPEEVPSKPKSRRLLWVMLLLILLGAAGGGAWFFYLKPKAEKGEPVSESKPVPAVYLPLDSVVINLADEGGDRFAQVGITFQIRDIKQIDEVKKVMPSIRNRILISLSERKAQDLLTKEGKERLAADILVEVGRAFGIEPPPVVPAGSEPVAAATTPPVTTPVATTPAAASPAATSPLKTAPATPARAPNPVVQVLFSSLIIQ